VSKRIWTNLGTFTACKFKREDIFATSIVVFLYGVGAYFSLDPFGAHTPCHRSTCENEELVGNRLVSDSWCRVRCSNAEPGLKRDVTIPGQVGMERE
jgi:hypothetical protein